MRLKSLLFSLLMLAGFSMAQATVVEIGSTSLSNSYMPFYSYYKYSYTQQIYPYYEMGASRNLSSISYYNTSSVARTRQIDLYLKNISKDTFNSNTDWISVTSRDIVFSGEVTFEPNSWTTILVMIQEACHLLLHDAITTVHYMSIAITRTIRLQI